MKDLRDGSGLKAALALNEQLKKEIADLKAEDKSRRRQDYGTRSQKSRKKNDDDDSGQPDPAQEKKDMGGKDSIQGIPENGDKDNDETDAWVESNYRAKRTYREGMKHRTMKADRICRHSSDPSAIPEGWTLVREEKRYAYDKSVVIVEHEYTYFIVRDTEGKEHVMFLPNKIGEGQWSQICDGEEKETSPLAPAADPITDRNGNPVIDCFPHTRASSGMMAQLVVDHYVNDIPYYRLCRHFRDNGMSISRQTLINWLYEGGRTLRMLIPLLLDMAVEKDSVINCDETWCKVRIKGKYKKRYIWCLVNKELKIVIYFFKNGARSRDALKSILGERSPKAIQTDGYNVYLYLDDELVDIEHIGCMAHSRAKFFYAWEAHHEPDAEYILKIIQDLYALEEHYEKLKLSPEEIKAMRNGERTTELIIRLRSKIDELKSPDHHPPLSEMLAKAVRYMDEFWKPIFAYRNDGRYSIDNTLVERCQRAISGERKNSLFYGSGKMAEISSVYRTLISTCRLMKVSVSEYFNKVFRKLVAGCDNLTTLLPMNMGLSVNNY